MIWVPTTLFPWIGGAITRQILKWVSFYRIKIVKLNQYRFGIRLGDLRDISLGIDQDLEKDVLPYYNFALDSYTAGGQHH